MPGEEEKSKELLRNVSFNYYQVFISYKEEHKRRKKPVIFNLEEWLLKMKSFNKMEDRNIATTADDIIRLNDESVIRRKNSLSNEDMELAIMQFTRLLDTNVPSKVKINASKMETVSLDKDEYIGHDVSAIFDVSNCVLMLQKNYFSLSKSAIESYINVFWNIRRKEKRNWDLIQILPIIDKDSFKKGKIAKKYKTLSFSTAPIPNTGKANPFSGDFGKIFDSMKAISGSKIDVTFSVPKQGDAVLDRNAIQNILDEIDSGRDKFKSAKVTAGDSNYELINLFGGRIRSVLPFELPPKEPLLADSVVTSMIAEYECKKREVEKNLNKVVSDGD